MYRYERPQTGRQRQFYQMGIENLCLNDSDSIHDVEIIMLASKVLNEILPDLDIRLEINSLGSQKVKQEYNNQLIKYFSQPDIMKNLSKESQKRVKNWNPLRVLDSKIKIDQELAQDWPKIEEIYDNESEEKFKGVLAGLDSMGVEYRVNNKLWRGLDYYEHTCFEFKINDKRLGRSQNTVLAGGRYDSLAQYLGYSRPISSVGK